MDQNENWYYMNSGVRCGPIAAESMVELVQNGSINENTAIPQEFVI